MTGLNIDGDAAHDAAQHELAKPIYPKPSLTDRLAGWFDELLYKAFTNGDWLPGGWITLVLLLVLVIAGVLIAVRVARRTMRSSRGADGALLDEHTRSSADHRTAAQTAAAHGDWGDAIRHRLRAIARELEESGVLDPVPGRTATELARAAGTALPGLLDRFQVAAETFNAVSYGARSGTEGGYRQIADLDDQLRGARTR